MRLSAYLCSFEELCKVEVFFAFSSFTKVEAIGRVSALTWLNEADMFLSIVFHEPLMRAYVVHAVFYRRKSNH